MDSPKKKWKQPIAPPPVDEGLYWEDDLESVIFGTSDFGSERDLAEKALASLTQFIDSPIVKVEQEVSLPKGQPRHRAKFRLDALVETEAGPVIIEFKNPKLYVGAIDLVNAVAQLQMYGTVYEMLHQIKPRLILVTSKYSHFLSLYLRDHGSDVEVVVLRREQLFISEGVYGRAA